MIQHSEILTLVPGFIVGLTLHEFSHALMAYRLGDPTAKQMGRLTLNPLKHLDVFGSLALIFAGFGWAKPVPVDSSHFRHPRRDMALVAIAGPLANVVLAFGISLFFRLLMMSGVATAMFESSIGAMIIVRAVWINVVLAIFNLIPVPPLDGSRILAGIVPAEWNHGYEQFERFGPIALIGLVLLAKFTGVSVLGRIVMPVADPLFKLVMGSWIFG